MNESKKFTFISSLIDDDFLENDDTSDMNVHESEEETSNIMDVNNQTQVVQVEEDNDLSSDEKNSQHRLSKDRILSSENNMQSIDSNNQHTKLYSMSSSVVNTDSRPLCKFFLNGVCYKGELCPFSHVLPSNMNVSNMNASNIHQTYTIMNYECPICHSNVIYEGKRFGILPNCSHIFCIDCIRQWRTSHSNDDHNGRMCPICHVESYFVVPSTKPIVDDNEKSVLIQAYKDNMSKIECTFYNHGKGKCPFGTNCFYKHTDENGEIHQPRLVMKSDGVLVDLKSTYSLTDFITVSKKNKNKNKKNKKNI